MLHLYRWYVLDNLTLHLSANIHVRSVSMVVDKNTTCHSIHHTTLRPTITYGVVLRTTQTYGIAPNHIGPHEHLSACCPRRTWEQMSCHVLAATCTVVSCCMAWYYRAKICGVTAHHISRSWNQILRCHTTIHDAAELFGDTMALDVTKNVSFFKKIYNLKIV